MRRSVVESTYLFKKYQSRLILEKKKIVYSFNQTKFDGLILNENFSKIMPFN
jgi:hypothetical protein